jgi:hypothetical protein
MRGFVLYSSELGTVADSCIHGNEPMDSISRRAFSDQLSECQLLKENSAPRSYLQF